MVSLYAPPIWKRVQVQGLKYYQLVNIGEEFHDSVAVAKVLRRFAICMYSPNALFV